MENKLTVLVIIALAILIFTLYFLFNNNSLNENPKNEYLEEDFFRNQNFRKIKKKLIYEIAEARIQELAEKILSRTSIESFFPFMLIFSIFIISFSFQGFFLLAPLTLFFLLLSFFLYF